MHAHALKSRCSRARAPCAVVPPRRTVHDQRPHDLPPPLTPNEIQQMTKQEAQQAMTAVARVRNRADVSDADKARLKAEFDLLLERCKRP